MGKLYNTMWRLLGAQSGRNQSKSVALIKKAADQTQVPFLNGMDPPWMGPGQMLADKSGPNDDGQSVIADHIAAWLRTEVKT